MPKALEDGGDQASTALTKNLQRISANFVRSEKLLTNVPSSVQKDL